MSGKKVLLVFELQKVLVSVLPSTVKTAIKPELVAGSFNIFERPHARCMMQELMTGGQEWDVAVWSSLKSDVISPAVKHFFGPLSQKLLFINTTRVVNTDTVKLLPHEPFAIARSIESVSQQFTQYNSTNVAVISCFKNVQPNFVDSEAAE